MSKVTVIGKDIEINKRHIDEFQLESEVGTKKMKEKFHKNAVTQRNIYVNNQQEKFQTYKKQVYKEMKDRVDNCFPVDKTDIYKKEKNLLSDMKEVIKFTNVFSDSSYKLGFLSMISRIKDDIEISLDEVNNILNEFIDKFLEAGITLNIDDFSYSMFTYKYMTDFFDKSKSIDLKTCFETIYWECPGFLKHLKLNLWMLLDKYKRELNNYSEKIKMDKLGNYNLNSNNVVSNYYEKVNKLDIDVRRDEYINLNNFLDKKRNISDYLEDSSICKNNFNAFVINNDFSSLSAEEKNKYYLEILDLAKTLPVLKMYYRYEFIVKDLQGKYDKRNENKNLYENKLKEIGKEEAKRKKIFSSYLRACGEGLFAKRDDRKISSCKLEMNEQVLKLYSLYNELHDLEIIYKMNKQLLDVSSLYDIFMLSYSSYFYLEKMFNENFKDTENFDINEEFIKYFDFIYNPNNLFLTKINGFVSYDIGEIISDKYKLLALKVEKNSIMRDTIDSTIDTVNFIRLVKDISDSNLSLGKMNFIVKFREFEEVELTDFIDVEVL